MPSWNIHTAIVERLLANRNAGALGIADANAFLFGNYVPDIYVGFMVPDASMRIAYFMTHMTQPDTTPVPDADRFWDFCIVFRKLMAPTDASLALGAWAHLATDAFFNVQFRAWCSGRETPQGDELRIAKQADFDVFGRSLDIGSHVEATPELLKAAWEFMPYRIFGDDVRRTVEAADRVVRDGGAPAPDDDAYQLLDSEWMQTTVDSCVEHLTNWLVAWQQLKGEGVSCKAADVRVKAGLPPTAFRLE